MAKYNWLVETVANLPLFADFAKIKLATFKIATQFKVVAKQLTVQSYT